METETDPHRCLTCGLPDGPDYGDPHVCPPGFRKERRPLADKVATRPQDWAPPARAHLFGMDTLNAVERERELARRAAYPNRYRQRG